MCVAALITALAPFALFAADPARDVGELAPVAGPAAAGTAPKADPPVTWDAKTNIKWKAQLPGHGSATPIVWGDRVFVSRPADRQQARAGTNCRSGPTVRAEDRSRRPTYVQFVVYCFDRNTGKAAGSRRRPRTVPHEGHHETHSYAAGSPTTDGSRLYVSFGSFGIYCYDLDGKPIWQRATWAGSTAALGWGEAVTPVVHGDSLLLNWDQEADSALYCLDAAHRRDAVEGRPRREDVVEHAARRRAQGRTQVIVNGTNRIRGYDLATGKVLWECGGMTVNAIPSPVSATAWST